MMESLPFIFDLNANFQGILRLEDEELVLEWRRVRGWPLLFSQGILNSFKKHPLQQVRIPLSQLEAIEFKNPMYLFHAMLHIRVRNLELLAPVPHSNGAEITIYCKKRYKNLAHEIANMATFQKLERVFPDKSTLPTV